MFKLLILSSVTLVNLAIAGVIHDTGLGGGSGSGTGLDYHHPQYKFSYSVVDHKSGDIKDHSESRDGDNVQGEYSLIEPDGGKRIVQYHASKHSGFNAIVRKEGGYSHRQDYQQQQNYQQHQGLAIGNTILQHRSEPIYQQPHAQLSLGNEFSGYGGQDYSGQLSLLGSSSGSGGGYQHGQSSIQFEQNHHQQHQQLGGSYASAIKIEHAQPIGRGFSSSSSSSLSSHSGYELQHQQQQQQIGYGQSEVKIEQSQEPIIQLASHSFSDIGSSSIGSSISSGHNRYEESSSGYNYDKPAIKFELPSRSYGL